MLAVVIQLWALRLARQLRSLGFRGFVAHPKLPSELGLLLTWATPWAVVVGATLARLLTLTLPSCRAR